jgi:pimeloyl-ACP methyl ester carboxylesterase
VFASSVGALIGLELAATDPGTVARLIVHEPPLGQLVPADDRASFDVELDQDNAGTALDQIAASIGLDRRRSPTGGDDRPEARQHDVELFIRRDVPAIAGYRLDLKRILSVAKRIVVTAGEEGRDFYPHRCAVALAAALSTTLVELPGNHAAMISRPAEFAARLTPLMR